MNHVNITVQGGAMVSTRRGLQVSKHRHNGTAFINSSAGGHGITGTQTQPESSARGTPGGGREITFVNNGGDGRRSRRKTRPPTDSPPGSNRRPLGMRKGTGQQRRVVSPCSTLSATSPASSTSHESVADDQSIAVAPGGYNQTSVKPLAPWAAYSAAQDASEPDQRLRFMALAFETNGSYHLRDEFAAKIKKEDVEQSTWRVQDATSLHCALTLGALFDAVEKRQKDTPQLNCLASQLYAIVNRRVSEIDQSNKARDVTLRAIASLAIVSGYQGKSEHWYVHMRGLLNLVELAGGWDELLPGTLDIIVRADTIGAISAATRPCTTLMEQCFESKTEAKSPPESSSASVIRLHLGPLDLDSRVIDTVAAVALLLTQREGVETSQSPPCTFQDFCNLANRLLLLPEPLQGPDELVSSSRFMNNLSIAAQDFPTPKSMCIHSIDATTKAVETALRILTLIYLKELMVDVPCDYGILLNLLSQQTASIRNGRSVQDEDEDLGAKPQLLQEASLPSHKPIIIWICLAAELFTQTHLAEHPPTKVGSHTAYGDILRGVLEADEIADVGRIPDSDLAFSRALDLQRIFGEKSDELDHLKCIIGVVK